LEPFAPFAAALLKLCVIDNLFQDRSVDAEDEPGRMAALSLLVSSFSLAFGDGLGDRFDTRAPRVFGDGVDVGFADRLGVLDAPERAEAVVAFASFPFSTILGDGLAVRLDARTGVFGSVAVDGSGR
jgi:hypothetical protein